MTSERSSARTALARVGFSDLTEVDRLLTELAESIGLSRTAILDGADDAADPDAATDALVRIARRAPERVRDALRETPQTTWRLLGASRGFADFYLRHPEELAHVARPGDGLPTVDGLRDELLEAVGADEQGFASAGDESAWVALRVRYRRLLARIAAHDLSAPDATAVLAEVAAALADAAGAALEASLCVARTRVTRGGGAPGGLFPRDEVAATQLAIIGMGKTGARELNYVSDVDVIFVGGADDDALAELGESRVIDIATRLAVQTMRGLSGFEIEPPLWEVDANLRPEGKQGALVRSLDSHLSYYDRWAKSWEFQALLKARPIAGDRGLGERYVAAVQPKVWTSAAR